MPTGNECACCKPPWAYRHDPDAGPITHRKLDNDGNVIWNADHGAFVWAIAVDGSGNVVVGGLSPDLDNTNEVSYWNSSGVMQWQFTHGATVRGVAFDGSGNIVIAGSLGSGSVTRSSSNCSRMASPKRPCAVRM